MKVTAILPDDLITEVQKYSGGKNVTESLQKALTDWLKQAKLRNHNNALANNPLKFKEDFSAEALREINRQR
ncbi:DUF2191 domain-containing protein [Leptospira sp. GIMC2001]|uniref:DUF2191 domain-containing protein n=1 Tax=Leptospira sp. GIMC2001 TaxID=1513297 RepID=UPI002349936B|nr:DUF2191 domain-containing protein [Leptospira sp. GIMC2001]WCL50710.1 DUF2191 domain-containing protein [Leptospira sp. GIMC2001]